MTPLTPTKYMKIIENRKYSKIKIRWNLNMDKWVIRRGKSTSKETETTQENLQSSQEIQESSSSSSNIPDDSDSVYQKLTEGLRVHSGQWGPEESGDLDVQYEVEVSMRDDDDEEDEAPQKKKKVENRLYKFRHEWCELPEFRGWLIRSKNPARQRNIEFGHCKLCNKDIFPNKHDVMRHSKSEKHLYNSRIVSQCKPLDVIMTPKSNSVKIAELKLVGLVATNNLPLVLMDTITPLLADIFPDSEIAKNLACRRSKATMVLKEGLGKNFQNQLCEKVSGQNNFYSLIMDETTDVGAIKQCAFTITFFDSDYVVKTRFLDMVATDKGDAASLYECLRSTLTKHKIPFQNMVGFSSDTTNVMVGEYNSIFSKLKKDLPEILCVRCSCHMIHLAASAACLQLPRSVEDVVRNIGAHFSRSYNRQCKFMEFQNFFRVDIHKIIMPSNTRWLSLEQCIKRILEQFEPLTAYFRLALFEDPSKTTETIVKTLENKYTLIYLQFMSYILEILNDFNKLFQTEAPLLYKLKPEIIRLLKTVCCNFLDKSYVVEEKDIFNIKHTNPRKMVPLEKIYLGVMAFESIESLKSEDNFDETEMNVFLKSALKFYIELVNEIKKRFQFSDDIFDLMSVVDPRESTSTMSLLPIIKRFTFLRNIIDVQKLDNEWREQSLINPQIFGVPNNFSVETYWANLFQLKNQAGLPLYPNLKVVIGLLLVLPFSNVPVERIFSKLKNIKSEHRNKLKTETVSALITTSEGIAEEGGCIKFIPTKKMLESNIWKKAGKE